MVVLKLWNTLKNEVWTHKCSFLAFMKCTNYYAAMVWVVLGLALRELALG